MRGPGKDITRDVSFPDTLVMSVKPTDIFTITITCVICPRVFGFLSTSMLLWILFYFGLCLLDISITNQRGYSCMRESCAELKVCFVSYYNYFLVMLSWTCGNWVPVSFRGSDPPPNGVFVLQHVLSDLWEKIDQRNECFVVVHDSGIGQYIAKLQIYYSDALSQGYPTIVYRHASRTNETNISNKKLKKLKPGI